MDPLKKHKKHLLIYNSNVDRENEHDRKQAEVGNIITQTAG